MKSLAVLVLSSALLMSSTALQAAEQRTSIAGATFITYEKGNPPADLRPRLQQMAGNAGQRVRDDGALPPRYGGYRALLNIQDMGMRVFSSDTVNVFYGYPMFSYRASSGTSAPGPWGASAQLLSSVFDPEGFVDGHYPLSETSSPGMDYALYFDTLPGLPGYSGFVSYDVQQGSLDLAWDRGSDSSSGAYAFTLLITPTPRQWGIGPDREHLMKVEGEFFDRYEALAE